MSSAGHHIRLRLDDDRVIAPTPGKRRLLARSVLAIGRPFKLLAFALADNHLHLLSACSRRTASEFARRLAIALHRNLQLETRFTPAYVGPIRDASHFYNTFNYILGQDRRHDLQCDPYREATNLPDMLGLRPLGSYTAANVRETLPRIKAQDLFKHLGVDTLHPDTKPTAAILEAAMMASALSHLSGRSPTVVETRRAIVHIASPHMTVNEVASLLSVTRHTVYRLARSRADAALVQAVNLQMSLFEKKRRHAAPTQPFSPSAQRRVSPASEMAHRPDVA